MKFNLVSVIFSTKSSGAVCLFKLKWNHTKTFPFASWNFLSHSNSYSQISLLLADSECRSKYKTNERRTSKFLYFLLICCDWAVQLSVQITILKNMSNNSAIFSPFPPQILLSWSSHFLVHVSCTSSLTPSLSLRAVCMASQVKDNYK